MGFETGWTDFERLETPLFHNKPAKPSSCSHNAPWERCVCGDMWCHEHGKHTHECSCPPIEEWTTDPYKASK